MRFRPVQKMKVILDLEGLQRELGTLAWSARDRLAYFEYSADFIAHPLLVSPYNLNLKAGLIPSKRNPF
jgi:serine/threonine-protein kinase HipA